MAIETGPITRTSRQSELLRLLSTASPKELEQIQKALAPIEVTPPNSPVRIHCDVYTLPIVTGQVSGADELTDTGCTCRELNAILKNNQTNSI